MAKKKATDIIAIQKDKTRTHIWYEVETNGAIQKKDIPFDIGVMSDLAGDRKDRKELRDREFVEINSENFDSVMSNNIKPTLDMELEFGGSSQKVKIDFKKLKDFGPEAVLESLGKQVKSVEELLAIRKALFDTRQTLNISRDFEKKLVEMLGNPEKLQQLKGELDKEKVE